VDTHELVRAVALEVMKRLRAQAERPCAMVLESRDEALAATVQGCLGNDTDVLFFGEDAGKRAPSRHILPSLSCCAMAELAVGRASGPFASEALRLLLAGVPVDVLKFEYRAYRETAPGPLYALYQAHEKTLAAFGMRQFRRETPGTVSLWDTLVTERTVLEARDKGASVLRVPVAAKVTPLAADTARNLHINIQKRS